MPRMHDTRIHRCTDTHIHGTYSRIRVSAESVEGSFRKLEKQGENGKGLDLHFQKSGNAVPVFRNSPYICTDVKHTDKDRESKGCAQKLESKRKSGRASKEERRAHGESALGALIDAGSPAPNAVE